MGRMSVLAVMVLLCGASAAAPVRKAPPVPSPQARIDTAVSALLKQSDAYFHDGEYENVAFCYETVVGLDPHNIEAWTTYGWFLWASLGRKDEAHKVLQKAIALNPESWEVYTEMGNLQYHRRQFLVAAAWFSKAMGRGAPWTTWHQRAHCLEYAGRHKQCVETWREIVMKFPDDAAAKVNLKRVKEGRFRKEPVIGVEARPGTEPAPAPEAEDLTPKGPLEPGSI